MTTGSTSDRSASGATLTASFTGETGAISETGFYYGTTSGSLGTKVPTGSTTSPFSKAITGLSANTTYYYKAYVVEYNESTSSTEERLGSEMSFTTKAVATAAVTSGSASSIAQTTAVLSGSFSGSTGNVDYTGFEWGLSAGNLTNDAMGSSTLSPFTATITGLKENTTYYYRAYVGEWNESTSSYEYRYGSVRSFTTQEASTSSGNGYLGCYEVPNVSGILSGSKTSGTNSSRGDNWFRYYTTSSKRQIATHTFTQASTVDGGEPQTRNYTVLYDQDNYAPVWVAYAMHSTTWKKILSGRSGTWGTDPAISLTQQTGLDNASTVGYSRGHMVSSQERQTTANQNEQTFYYTNQAPQWQNSFNSGVWSTMENAIVSNAPSGRDTLYIVTGVLYEESWYTANPGKPRTLSSGSYTVPIPSHFYKCLMKCSFNASGTMTSASGIAYVFSNEAHSGNYYDSAYVSTIDAVEARAGFDFFPNVPASLQTSAESTATALWTY